MIIGEITLNNLMQELYGAPNPIFTYSTGLIEQYDFICKFIPNKLLEYNDGEYNYKRIWGAKKDKNSFYKFMNRAFIPVKFKESFFKLLNNNFNLVLEIESNFKKEWDDLKGDKRILKDMLFNTESFNKNNYEEWVIDYINNDDSIPERILTIIFLYAIIDKKALLLYKNNCPDILEVKHISNNTEEKKEVSKTKAEKFSKADAVSKIIEIVGLDLRRIDFDDKKSVVFTGFIYFEPIEFAVHLLIREEGLYSVIQLISTAVIDLTLDKNKLFDLLNEINQEVHTAKFYINDFNNITVEALYRTSKNNFNACTCVDLLTQVCNDTEEFAYDKIMEILNLYEK